MGEVLEFIRPPKLSPGERPKRHPVRTDADRLRDLDIAQRAVGSLESWEALTPEEQVAAKEYYYRKDRGEGSVFDFAKLGAPPESA